MTKRKPRIRTVLGRHDGYVLFRTTECREGIDGVVRPYILGTYRLTEAQYATLR